MDQPVFLPPGVRPHHRRPTGHHCGRPSEAAATHDTKLDSRLSTLVVFPLVHCKCLMSTLSPRITRAFIRKRKSNCQSLLLNNNNKRRFSVQPTRVRVSLQSPFYHERTTPGRRHVMASVEQSTANRRKEESVPQRPHESVTSCSPWSSSSVTLPRSATRFSPRPTNKSFSALAGSPRYVGGSRSGSL